MIAERAARLSQVNPKFAKSLLEAFAELAEISSQMLSMILRQEEVMAEEGLTVKDFQDPMFLPRLFGESRPDLIGRFIVATIKMTQLQTRTRDLTVLTPDEKREAAKQFHELGAELKSIGEEMGR